ncbi:MAG TPA: hypothetical protein VK694_06495 [Verrucomicrobiae bacterium]|nr:hypothetical protein [Verrucomicrobiae bacterium]
MAEAACRKVGGYRCGGGLVAQSIDQRVGEPVDQDHGPQRLNALHVNADDADDGVASSHGCAVEQRGNLALTIDLLNAPGHQDEGPQRTCVAGLDGGDADGGHASDKNQQPRSHCAVRGLPRGIVSGVHYGLLLIRGQSC